MHTLRVVPLLGLLALAPTVSAQSATGAPQTRVPTAADSAILRALDLPRVMQRAREAGIPDSSIRGVMDRIRQRGVPAGDATTAVEMEVETVERGGNRENFGAFVRAQVESGLRGRELAAAIRAERQRRGMSPEGRGGRPETAGPPDGRGGRPETAGPPAGRGGRPEGAGARPEGRGGRPDSTARPEVRGNRPPAGGPARQRPDSIDKPPTRGKRP
jgi:hypothetical protein